MGFLKKKLEKQI